MYSELTEIENWTGIKQTNCSCSTCVSMCHRQVCIGTPVDIAKLIIAGHIAKVKQTLWAAGMEYNYFHLVEMIQLEFLDTEKRCCMLDENNRCMLHECGLKPTEGKLAGCSRVVYTKEEVPPILAVAHLWRMPAFKPLITYLVRMVDAYESGCDVTAETETLQMLIDNIDKN